jgi:uncharacterized membrane protein YoaK (UPF0700 family)
MSATTNTTVPVIPSTTGSLAATGVVATALASGATTIVAAAGNAAGISLELGGAPLPVSGFALLTAFFSLVGLVLAAVMSRRARRPRGTFVRTTVALTALSFVPDLVVDAAPATKALLMLTHVVAAAIVIPALARRLTA